MANTTVIELQKVLKIATTVKLERLASEIRAMIDNSGK